jgi:hypothetical protein
MVNFDEKKVRYLEMIQSVTTRMATYSFSLKGWTVTLVAGILALSSKEADKTYLLIALLPILVFWFLDSYYLQLERTYRALFNYVRENSNAEINFEMRLSKFKNVVSSDRKLKYFSCFFSKTEWLFYIPTGVVVGVVMKLTHVF